MNSKVLLCFRHKTARGPWLLLEACLSLGLELEVACSHSDPEKNRSPFPPQQVSAEQREKERGRQHLAKGKTKNMFLGNGTYVIDGRHFPEYIRKRKILLVFKIKIRNPQNRTPTIVYIFFSKIKTQPLRIVLKV